MRKQPNPPPTLAKPPPPPSPPPPDNGSGFLEVGINERHEIVINLPRDMTGHIVFSVAEALHLSSVLAIKALDALKEAHHGRKIS
jgi:hypothetical protein